MVKLNDSQIMDVFVVVKLLGGVDNCIKMFIIKL